MLNKRKRESTEKLDRCYKVVQQSRTGISAKAIAVKLNLHRSTIHRLLNTLELMGKVYSEHGLWYPKEARFKPIPKNSFRYMQKLYEKIIELRLNPQPRYREDGSIYYYHNTFEIIPAIRILAEMHPSIKELVVGAIKNSKLTSSFKITEREVEKRMENLVLTSQEVDLLIGKIGKTLDEIERSVKA